MVIHRAGYKHFGFLKFC